MRVRVSLLAIFALVATLAATSSAWSTARVEVPQPGVATLVQGGTIEAFAQDGNRIAWVTSRSAVVMRDAAGGRATRLGSLYLSGEGIGCADTPDDPSLGPPKAENYDDCGLTMAGDRALFWIEVGAMHGFKSLFTASLAQPGKRRVALLVTSPAGAEGEHLVGPRGDGADLIYGVASVQTNGLNKPFSVSGGGVVRVIGEQARTLPGIGAPALLDVAAGRLAVVPAVRRLDRGPVVVGAPLVEIRKVGTARLLRTIELGGTPTAIALSSQVVAALIQGQPARIERYDVATGRQLGATTVAGTPANELDASFGIVVYRSNGMISMLDEHGTSVELARAAGLPLGLSIEGRRVAWAENRGKQGYVRAVIVR